jgi:hypothetical protein
MRFRLTANLVKYQTVSLEVMLRGELSYLCNESNLLLYKYVLRLILGLLHFKNTRHGKFFKINNTLLCAVSYI